MNTHLLRGDPKDVDKILADELNALSFHDREALSEEMHGVRSLAPVETPEMIQKALIGLQFEFEGRLKVALVSLPSRNVHRNSNHIDNSRNNSRNNSNHNSSDAINSDCNSEDVSRRKYLNDLLKASEFFTSSSSCSSRVEGSRNYTKYSYALSDAFKLKFLRAELFDVKKAATRYLKCIDFLVAYFGLVALERPLYLKDLDKAEQKLMREGHCQLMPSRDRFGRRIVVFQGAVGKGYSHRNLFKVVLYTVFQAASDDETTQRNGLVAVYSVFETSAVEIYRRAYHQTEAHKFFEAVPIRYSAFHCILPEGLDVLKVLILNMVGKKTRLITRIHSLSPGTETSYTLQCFGIPTEDFPVTSSGSIKNKKHMKWIKFRASLEEAYERGDELSSYYQLPPALQNLKREISSQSSSPFLGIECPQINSVVFRNGGSASKRPANFKFREILTKMELDRDNYKTAAEKSAYLDRVIAKLFSSGLTFLLYDNENDWYVELRDGAKLRKKVFQALRDQSARRKRLENKHQQRGQDPKSKGRMTADVGIHQSNESSTNIFMALDHAKRRKTGCMDLKDCK